MTCQDRIFAGTDINIPITFTGVLSSDIAELYVKFVNRDDPATNRTYLLSTGGVTIVDGNITVVIGKTDITVPGIYDIYIKRTNPSGKVFGVVPCPGIVNFYPML